MEYGVLTPSEWRLSRRVPPSQERGEGLVARIESSSSRNFVQSASFRLRYERAKLDGERDGSGKVTRMGRWSELSWVRVVQVTERARCAVMRVMSGEDEEPRRGRCVGVSVFKTTKSLLSISSAMEIPRASFDVEYHPS